MDRLVAARRRQGLRWGVAAAVLAATAAGQAADGSLRDAGLLQLPDGERLMAYIVSCALPAGQTVRAPGRPGLRWHGAMGLVPAWRDRALTEAEQRLLSACLLARVNALGATVPISMRAVAAPRPAALRAGRSERLQFDRLEGAFFGNLFSGQPVAYACSGDGAADRSAWLERAQRLCTLPAALPGFTRCGFVDLGTCSPGVFVQRGIDHTQQAIEVHLPR